MRQSTIKFSAVKQSEDKALRNLKRFCVAFASAAITLAALDLMNVRAVDAAAEFSDDSSVRVGALPDRIRSEIDMISVVPPARKDEPVQVIVAIPRDEPPPAQNANTLTVRDVASSGTLAAAPDRDAVAAAMTPAQTSAPAPMKFASAVDVPDRALPDATPVSLPAADMIRPAPAPKSRVAPVVLPPSPAQRLRLTGKDYAKAERCLANAVYFEARSEPLRGQMAVAQVVMNRVFSGFYPRNVCAVVYQNASHHLACQFTFACDGKRKIIDERAAWARANRIARETLDGKIYVPEVGKSTHYHAVYVHPNWVHEMRRLVRFGLHAFYRPIAWGNGSYEPVWGKAALAQATSRK